ncbi:hypothetical protein GCM10010282_37970 [Streptomyces roseolus]|nr:hypothetical protein GCM10010282_37970 [Streptomyces roseolus]
MVEVSTSHPEPGGGLLGSERGLGGDQVRQVLTPADLLDLAGMVQRPVRVRAQVDQEALVDQPPHHECRHVRQLAVNSPARDAESAGDPVGRRAAADTSSALRARPYPARRWRDQASKAH